MSIRRLSFSLGPSTFNLAIFSYLCIYSSSFWVQFWVDYFQVPCIENGHSFHWSFLILAFLGVQSKVFHLLLTTDLKFIIRYLDFESRSWSRTIFLCAILQIIFFRLDCGVCLVFFTWFYEPSSSNFKVRF